jgi:CRP/FNR family cyclic AMP-dependent transcriptional regulator
VPEGKFLMIAGDKENIHSILKSHPFFNGLESEFMKVIIDSASIEEIATHQYLFYEGESASNFYLVLEGLIGIQVFAGEGGFINIQKVGSGEIIGWSWLLPPNAWFFSGEVLEPSRVVTFNGENLRNICESNHDLGYELAKRLTTVVIQRLSETRLKLFEFMD